MAAGFMTHVTCRLTAKNRDQLRNPIRSVIEYGLPLPRGVLPSLVLKKLNLRLTQQYRTTMFIQCMVAVHAVLRDLCGLETDGLVQLQGAGQAQGS